MANLTFQPWDDFTTPNKYAVPGDVNTLLDRLRVNATLYAGNYLALAGAVLVIGVLFNFGTFFTLALALGAGYGAWFGLSTYVAQVRPHSTYALIGCLLLGFYIGIKLVGEEYSMVVWQYAIFSLLPGLLHAVFKKRNPVTSAAHRASNVVKEIKRELK